MTRALPAAALVLAIAHPATAQDPAAVRDELQHFAMRLDGVVDQVSFANADVFSAGTASCRPYLLRGYGIVFVVPPRTLPRPSGLNVRQQRGPGGRPLNAQERQLLMIEQQVDQFMQEAEQASLEAEQAFLAMLQEVERRKLMAEDARRASSPTSAGGPPPSDLASPPRSSKLGPDHEALEPPLPSGISGPEPPPVELRTYPTNPPPWKSWFGQNLMRLDRRPPERVVADVREAITAVLETFGTSLSVVKGDESVSVVVDFVSGAPFLEDARPSRSLVVRARKKDLDDRQAGRLTSDELKRRLEAVEY